MDFKRSEFIVLPRGKINYPHVIPERCLSNSFFKASKDEHSTASQAIYSSALLPFLLEKFFPSYLT